VDRLRTKSVRSWLEFERDGPNGVLDARDVTALGDSAFVIADGPTRTLKALDLDGALVWKHALSFMPDRVISVAGGIVIFPLLLPGLSNTVAYYLRAGELTDVGISPVTLPDPQMQTLANLVTPTVATGTSRLVVPHQFIAPQATIVDFEGGSPLPPQRVTVPLAAPLADRAWWIPEQPYSEEEMESLVAPALASTGGPEVGEITILTRTGLRSDDFTEKALLRLDEKLSVVTTHILPFNATHIAYFANTRQYVIVTLDEEWYRCTSPIT
jgi:hypothetical protein